MSSPATMGAITLRDVAAVAGVHTATASRVLGGNSSNLVAEDTARKVRRAAVRLGYRPDLYAAGLRTQRTRTIGVLAADLADPLLARLVQGADDALRDAGYMMLAASTGRTRTRQRAALSAMLSRRADGLLIAAAARSGLAAVADTEIPAVAAGYVSPRLPSASADLAAAIRLVAEHLVSLGHRTVACVSCAGGALPVKFLAGAIGRAGLTVPPGLAATALAVTAEEGQRRCRALLAAGTAFTAIIADSDLLAAGCCAALAAAGISCPDDVSVTGFGDQPLSGSLWPSLTTIRLPQYDVGAAAARLLLSQLQSGATPRSLQLMPSLLARDSTGHAGCRHELP